MRIVAQGSSRWLSPSWNWGYAVGDAHDAAARVRAKLSTPDARRQWLDSAASGDIEIGEVRLLGRGEREGMVGRQLPSFFTVKHQCFAGVAEVQPRNPSWRSPFLSSGRRLPGRDEGGTQEAGGA